MPGVMEGSHAGLTSVEGHDLAIVGGPEAFALVLCILRRGAVLLVRVLGVHAVG